MSAVEIMISILYFTAWTKAISKSLQEEGVRVFFTAEVLSQRFTEEERMKY